MQSGQVDGESSFEDLIFPGFVQLLTLHSHDCSDTFHLGKPFIRAPAYTGQ